MGQSQQVMADIKLIRAALAEQGDRLQKFPRKAVWVVHHHTGQSYRLTYQRAPLNGWAIHPPDSEASQILGVIDRALDHQPSINQVGGTETCQQSTYQQQLHPWCIIQRLPQMQHRIVARFRRRNDADAHLRVLMQHSPLTQYTIIFDPVLEAVAKTAKERSSANL